MADYPTLPPLPSTPDSDPRRPRLDPAEPVERADTARLLDTLDAIPRSELPAGDDRACLGWLISHGYVDNLYTEFGHATHTIAWAHRPPWRDPRETVADWLAARRAFDATGALSGWRKEARELDRELGE